MPDLIKKRLHLQSEKIQDLIADAAYCTGTESTLMEGFDSGKKNSRSGSGAKEKV